MEVAGFDVFEAVVDPALPPKSDVCEVPLVAPPNIPVPACPPGVDAGVVDPPKRPPGFAAPAVAPPNENPEDVAGGGPAGVVDAVFPCAPKRLVAGVFGPWPPPNRELDACGVVVDPPPPNNDPVAAPVAGVDVPPVAPWPNNGFGVLDPEAAPLPKGEAAPLPPPNENPVPDPDAPLFVFPNNPPEF